MTRRDIFGRMKRHFGGISKRADVGYAHRWTGGSARQDIEKNLRHGDMVLYPIELELVAAHESERLRFFTPELVEKQLLLAYAEHYGDLPPLNLSM